jgi:hypothetical protein
MMCFVQARAGCCKAVGMARQVGTKPSVGGLGRDIQLLVDIAARFTKGGILWTWPSALVTSSDTDLRYCRPRGAPVRHLGQMTSSHSELTRTEWSELYKTKQADPPDPPIRSDGMQSIRYAIAHSCGTVACGRSLPVHGPPEHGANRTVPPLVSSSELPELSRGPQSGVTIPHVMASRGTDKIADYLASMPYSHY